MIEEVAYRIVWSEVLADGTRIEWVEAFSYEQEVALAYLRRAMESLQFLEFDRQSRRRVWVDVGITVQGARRL